MRAATLRPRSPRTSRLLDVPRAAQTRDDEDDDEPQDPVARTRTSRFASVLVVPHLRRTSRCRIVGQKFMVQSAVLLHQVGRVAGEVSLMPSCYINWEVKDCQETDACACIWWVRILNEFCFYFVLFIMTKWMLLGTQ